MLRREQKIKNLILLILFSIIFIGVGYAIISTSLNINGNLDVGKITWDVHFDNFKEAKDNTVPSIEHNLSNSDTLLIYSVKLNKPGDKYSFTIDVVNNGTIDAMIGAIDPVGLSSEQQKVIDYSIKYLDGRDVNINDGLLAGVKETLVVTVNSKIDIDSSLLKENDENLSLKLDLEYVQADDKANFYNQHRTTQSAMSKEKFKSFGETNTPTEIKFVNTGVSDYRDSKYEDVSEAGDKSILAWMDGETMYVSAREKDLWVKAPEDSSSLFGDDVTWIKNINKIDILKFDVSDVTTMNSMFYYAGYNVDSFEIIGLKNWDTSSVTDMYYMFAFAGFNATTWNIGDISKWDTSSVTDMGFMFFSAGHNAISWTIGDIGNWDTSIVKSIRSMFDNTGYKATIWNIGDISKWDTSRVENMSYMFNSAGYQDTNWNIGDISKWDTSRVTDMSRMFYYAGYSATTWNIGDIGKWDTSNITLMESMFNSAGYNATTWNIGDIGKWNTSKVKNMDKMFYNAGINATYSLNLSGWNVNNVTYHGNFSYGVTDKIISPKWSK